MCSGAGLAGSIQVMARPWQQAPDRLPNRDPAFPLELALDLAMQRFPVLITQQAPRGRAESAGDTRLQGFLRLPASSADWLRSDLGNHVSGWPSR
jgi:hypothetical protein